MRSRLFILTLAFAIGAGGCAWSDQRVELRPTIPFARSDLAAGRAVDLRVADERSRTAIGHRIRPGVGGWITTSQDLERLIRDVFSDALRRYGFAIAPSGANDAAILDVELLSFEYEVARGLVSISVHAWAALDASCQSDGRRYETFYREHVVRANRSYPLSPERNEALLNEALSGLLRQPFADRKLLDCLAGSEPSTDRSDQTP